MNPCHLHCTCCPFAHRCCQRHKLVWTPVCAFGIMLGLLIIWIITWSTGLLRMSPSADCLDQWLIAESHMQVMLGRVIGLPANHGAIPAILCCLQPSSELTGRTGHPVLSQGGLSGKSVAHHQFPPEIWPGCCQIALENMKALQMHGRDTQRVQFITDACLMSTMFMSLLQPMASQSPAS